eukprot:784369-Prymnesium_polylepis.1
MSAIVASTSRPVPPDSARCYRDREPSAAPSHRSPNRNVRLMRRRWYPGRNLGSIVLCKRFELKITI